CVASLEGRSRAASARRTRPARTHDSQGLGGRGVSGKEGLNGELGEGDVDWRAEDGGGAEERQHAVFRRKSERYGDAAEVINARGRGRPAGRAAWNRRRRGVGAQLLEQLDKHGIGGHLDLVAKAREEVL